MNKIYILIKSVPNQHYGDVPDEVTYGGYTSDPRVAGRWRQRTDRYSKYYFELITEYKEEVK